jgi:hypothetical protein
MQRALVIGIAVFFAGARVVYADRDPSISAASKVYEVSGEGGAFEVPVHRGYVTLLHFPDKVVRAFASNQEDFDVYPYKDRDVVTVRARTDRQVDGNIVVITESIRVSLHVYTAGKREALFQVFFRHKDREDERRAQVAREVDRRVAAAEKAFAASRAALIAGARRRAEAELAASLLKRIEERPLRVADRNDQNVVVRVQRVLWIGDDAYLFFEVQNRDLSIYRPSTLGVTAGERMVGTAVRFAGEQAAELGEAAVPAGERRAGVVALPGAEKLRGRMLTMTVAEAGGARRVTVSDIRLP